MDAGKRAGDLQARNTGVECTGEAATELAIDVVHLDKISQHSCVWAASLANTV